MPSFSRNLLGELTQWKNSAIRKPLILRGARQVGKTTLVNLFAKQFDQYIYLNLEKPEEARLFKDITDFPQLLEALFFLKGKKRAGGPTLVFLDEVQGAPQALQALRYFYEETPEIYVIAAGSLLETLLEEKTSVPVGRVEYRVLRPVSFNEFLSAMGEEGARDQFQKVPLPGFAHGPLMKWFHAYAVTGGMPEVVSHYAHHRDLTSLIPIYESLLVSYMDDVEKYARNATLTQVIRHAIRATFGEAGTRITFHHFGKSNYGSREVGEALRTLEKAMLLHLVYPTVHTSLPLLPDVRKSPRLQVLDTGLMNHFAGIQRELVTSPDLQSVYQGKMIEHLVGQELLSSHFNVLYHLSFWVRQKEGSSAEVDFVLEVKGLLIPVEVKSGATGKLKSLFLFMDQVSHPWAVRLYGGPLQRDEVATPNGKKFTLLSMPYFLASQTERYVLWMMEERPANLG